MYNPNETKILNYIFDTQIEKCDEKIQNHMKKCFLDLALVISSGTRNNSSRCSAEYAQTVLKGDEVTVLRSGAKSSLLGATMANATAANALDIDDGYNMTMGHPGAGIISGILAAAEYADCTYGEFLSALLVGYEIAMRQGLSLQNYYNFYHSTGSYAGFGSAAAIAKLFKLDKETTNNALGIADYYSPFVPCMRTVRVPSLNKDGIYYGAKLGMESVLLAQHGIDGKAYIMSDPEYSNYVDTLGSKYFSYDLYFKFFSCCRWGHGALTAMMNLKKTRQIDASKIEKIDVYSYGASGELYSSMPQTETEAQYNMRYPLAVYLLKGKFGPIQSSIEIDQDSRIEDLMNKITFINDPDYEKEFPAKRITRVEIFTTDGEVIISEPTQPKGEATSDVTVEDIIEKGYDINCIYSDKALVDDVIAKVLESSYDEKFSTILNAIKKLAFVDK